MTKDEVVDMYKKFCRNHGERRRIHEVWESTNYLGSTYLFCLLGKKDSVVVTLAYKFEGTWVPATPWE